jgi:SAM-dependent methyltransferase
MKKLPVEKFYAQVWREYADPRHHPITERSLAVQKRVVADRILKLQPRRVLDLGCGPEPVIQPEQAPVVVWGDIVPEMLRHIKQGGSSPVVCLDARHLPFQRKTFDLVWCGLLSDHLRDLAGWFRELVRVLSRGGTLGMACWDRSRLPPDRYPQDREMAYTTSRGEELAVESLANWEETLERMGHMDPRLRVETCPILPEEYTLQVAFARVPPGGL